MVMVQQSSQNGAGAAAGLKKYFGGQVPEASWPPVNSSLRVKRPMLGGRRILRGPSTPVPRWKLYENPFYDGIAAAAAAAAAAQQQQRQQHQQTAGRGGRSVAVSARKLAATLWELQEFPFAFAAAASKSSACPCIRHRASSKARDHLAAFAENGTPLQTPSCHERIHHPEFFHHQRASIAKEAMVSLQHPNKAWESVKKSSQSQSSSRQVAAMRSHVHRLVERRADSRLTHVGAPSANSGSLMVLNRIGDMQEQHQTGTTQAAVAALRTELERVRARAHELELAHKSARREIDNLLKKMAEEKTLWRNQEQENIRSAVQALKTEADEDKKARRRIESANRKMSRELVEANMAVEKALQELEREKKARELMEDVCNELAREIGEDKAEVEEWKRESAKVREEIEEERKMLQMAEVWREERVQMKLAEARLEIEEKHTILDSLRSELETFLKTWKSLLNNVKEDEASCRVAVQEAENLKTAMDSLQIRDGPQNSCRSSDTEEEAVSGLSEVEQNPNNKIDSPHPDERGGGWGWGPVKPPSSVYGESNLRFETRDQVLERLRRQYDQDGHKYPSANGGAVANNAVGASNWEDERDGSEWSEEFEGDDAKEEDGSQWESASEQDSLEAMQHSNSRPSTGSGRGAGDESGPHIDVMEAAASAGNSGLYENIISPQTYVLKPSAEFSSGDDLRKGNTFSGGKGLNEEQQQRRLSWDGSRNLHGRGMIEVPRGSQVRVAMEQGVASPSRDWRSPDRGNPHIARGIKGFIEWPKMSRENGTKGKSLESKVEKVDRRILKQTI